MENKGKTMLTKLILETEEDIIVRTNADYGLYGQVGMITGAIIALIIFLFSALIDSKIMMLMLVPGSMLFISLFLNFSTRVTSLKKNEKKISHEKDLYDYNNFKSVLITTYTQTTTYDEFTTNVPRYIITLIKNDGNSGLFDEIDKFIELLKEIKSIDSGDEPDETLIEKIKENYKNVIESTKNSITIGGSGNEIKVFQAAERIAKELNIPLIDISGQNPLCLKPEELNLSLKERLIFSIHFT